jgi:hypothetical protein
MTKSQEILKEYFPNHRLNDKWDFELLQFSAEDMIDFANYVAKKSLEKASENIILTYSEFRKKDDGHFGWIEKDFNNLWILNDGANIVAKKSSIINPENIICYETKEI